MGVCPGGVSAPGGVCPGRCLPRGVFAQVVSARRGLPRGVSARGVSAGGVCQTPPMDRMTDACENITHYSFSFN